MKLLYCIYCKDITTVTPVVRNCFCGKSQSWYAITMHKEVYSGPALLLGIYDNDVFDLETHLDKTGFYKSVWVVIPPKSSTILKVKNVLKFYEKELERGLTRRQTGRYNAAKQSSRQSNIKGV